MKAPREPLLFKAFPALRSSVPWMALGRFPTPVHRMENLGRRLCCEGLYVKRDDLSGDIYGGNKVRKLEFVLADVIGHGRNPVITMGALGSNHVLATTLYGARSGLATIGIFMPQPVQEYVRTNILCNYEHGCKIEYVTGPLSLVTRSLEIYVRELVWNGHRPYLLAAGGSSTLGILGYVEAALEIADQVRNGLLPEPEFIFVPVGSGGTFAGLVLGLRLSGIGSTPVGVRVYSKAIANKVRISSMADRTLRYLRHIDPSVPDLQISSRNLVMLDDYYGPGYAYYTRKGVQAIELLQDLEGITLEGTYSGKAMAAFIEFMNLTSRRTTPALFINTYNSIPLDPLLRGCPGPEILPRSIQKYLEKEIAPVSDC